MSAAGGAVTHSGDNKDGAGDGDDETIKLELDNLSADIKYVVFVVTAHNEGGSFKYVSNARAQLRDLTPNDPKRDKKVISSIAIGGHKDHSALILCALIR